MNTSLLLFNLFSTALCWGRSWLIHWSWTFGKESTSFQYANNTLIWFDSNI